MVEAEIGGLRVATSGIYYILQEMSMTCITCFVKSWCWRLRAYSITTTTATTTAPRLAHSLPCFVLTYTRPLLQLNSFLQGTLTSLVTPPKLIQNGCECKKLLTQSRAYARASSVSIWETWLRRLVWRGTEVSTSSPTRCRTVRPREWSSVYALI